MPNALITSHTGGKTSRYETRVVEILLEHLRCWEVGEPFMHQIV